MGGGRGFRASISKAEADASALEPAEDSHFRRRVYNSAIMVIVLLRQLPCLPSESCHACDR